ncbi:hypothetical protein M9458_041411 [Cirrhinus mrigala]|uniref:Uncharacterized protein n=1 Tax=Cirrhinus mrigala TaxID=683832 RepID=A0ABD0NKU7_CIRMR
MENTTLVCSGQGWCGPNVSTFSSEWDDNVNSFLMAPDVIKPPPQFQDPEEPGQASPTESAAVIRREKDCVKKERRSRPSSNIELHRRSLSLSTTVNSNPGVARRRCESYALSYPSSSSEDSGSDSTSVRRGDRLPDAVPRSRSRSIVLKKAKRKPAPPVRTVSLQRLAAEKYSEHKSQGLHLKKDSQNIITLPDLIPTSKQEVSKIKKPSPTAEAPGKVTLKTSVSSHRALNELRSSEPCKSGLGPSMATPINEGTLGNSELNTSPSSSHSSPSQPSISSPSKRFGSNSPSSGYASQCETPTQSVLSSVTAGPSQLACRMRHKPSSVIPGQRARNRNARLSLQLPELQQHAPDPEPVQPKVNRRYSDSTEATRPKQRMSNSLLIMPVVTQEDLNNVRLRSVSSSDLENAQETTTDVIEEETERGGNSSSPTNHQKAKPPVAPKPQRNKWPPTKPVIPSERPEDVYAMINKAKPTVTAPSKSTEQAHQRQQKDCYFLEEQTPHPKRESRQPQPPCTFEPQKPNALPINTTTCYNQKKRRAPPPPLTKTPCVDNSLYYNPAAQKSPDDPLSPSKLCKSPKSPMSASQYHVTLYGVIPSYPMVVEQQDSSAPDSNAPDTFKTQKGSKDIVKIVHVTSVIQL